MTSEVTVRGLTLVNRGKCMLGLLQLVRQVHRHARHPGEDACLARVCICVSSDAHKQAGSMPPQDALQNIQKTDASPLMRTSRQVACLPKMLCKTNGDANQCTQG